MDLDYLGYILYMDSKEKEGKKDDNLANYKEVNPKLLHNAEILTPTTEHILRKNTAKSQNITPLPTKNNI